MMCCVHDMQVSSMGFLQTSKIVSSRKGVTNKVANILFYKIFMKVSEQVGSSGLIQSLQMHSLLCSVA